MSPQSKDETPTPRCDAPLKVTEGEFHGEQGYWLVRDGGAFFQRKDVTRATDRPLSAVELDTIALCTALLAAERDAERYRWIKSHRWPGEVDEAIIDAALAGKQEEGR